MKALLVTFFAVALSACAGTPFSMNNARQIQVGMTEQEVTALMGQPYSVVSKGEEEVWIWSEANGFTGAHQSISFIMKGGKVVVVPKIPDSF